MAAPRKRTRAKKSRGETRTKTRVKTTSADTEPVTLAEAKALALAKQPKLAPRAIRKDAVPPASPAKVGAEREHLEKERRDEIARRVREYKATMEIMKERGARRPMPKGAAKPTRKEPVSFMPLQLFAEGDSWFDYPIPFFGGGIISRLEKRLGVPILNLAKAGDEIRYMLGVEERTLLTEHLRKGCPAGGPWDVLVFSGGGNDIVDNPMALWIKDWNQAVPAAEHIHQPRFDTAMALVRAGYEDLITLRDKLSPSTHLVLHCYDFAIPDGRGICGYGPWLKPAFDLRQFPMGAARQDVVKTMLQQFAAMLASLATQPKVTLIDTQGTLLPQTNSWHNELHPSRAGFNRFADVFYRELKRIYPDRVA